MATVPALADGQPAALIVAAIRGDFIDRASRFQPLEQAISSGPFTVTAMTESDLKEAITGPAIEAGIEVTDDLTAAILDDLRGRRVPGGYETGALPLLSHVLFKMWGQGGNNGLTLANYRRTGGVADIVRRSADAVYESLAEDQRDVARRIFIQLIAHSGDGRMTARPTARAALKSDGSVGRVADIRSSRIPDSSPDPALPATPRR